MFLQKYVSEIYYDLITSNYEELFLENLNEKKFIYVYRLFIKYKFYFIQDIILKYLEIFMMDYNDIENSLIILKEELGENFVNIIGENMTYLDRILNNEN